MNSLLLFANKTLRLLTRSSLSPRLPELLFLVGTYFFPQVNIELIVRINNDRVIFSWRNDSFGNKGWHLPGSIILPNESFVSRIKALIKNELPFLAGYTCESLTYAGFSEVFAENIPSIRSHFISHIYLIDYYLPDHVIDGLPPAFMASHTIPEELISNHYRYKSLIRRCLSGHLIVPQQYY